MKTLLIVDDSPIIIERLVEALKDHESVKRVLTAHSYEEAVATLAEYKPQIVLLDIQLGEKNGIDLLKYVVKEYPDTKPIMFSNLADENYFKLCRDLGAIYCFDKSKDFELIPGYLK